MLICKYSRVARSKQFRCARKQEDDDHDDETGTEPRGAARAASVCWHVGEVDRVMHVQA